MSSVFYHLTRTGGSTVWHTLIASARDNNVLPLDLFHHSSVKFGSAYNALAALLDLAGFYDFAKLNLIIHHHSRQNIVDVLNPKTYSYCTVVRDPFERLISEVTHVRRSILSNSFSMGEGEYYRNNLSEKLWASLAEPEHVSLDDLLLLSIEDRFFVDYYIQSFWQLLLSKSVDGPLQFSNAVSEQFVIELALKAKEAFMFIGWFPNLRKNIETIRHITNMSDPNWCTKNVMCGASKLPLRAETAEWVKKKMFNEYRFIDELMRGGPSCFRSRN